MFLMARLKSSLKSACWEGDTIWNCAFDVSNAVFSKLGLKLPCASKKSRLGETVPTTAQVARADGGSSGSVGMSTRSF